MSAIIVGAKILNSKALETKLAAAFDKWCDEDINGTGSGGEDGYWYTQFRDMSLWPYGRETMRENKELVDSPRDIYDLGELYDSGRKSFNVDFGTTTVVASWNWNATGGTKDYHYAHDVHEGQGTSGGYPRRWTDELANPLNFDQSAPQLALLARIKKAFL